MNDLISQPVPGEIIMGLVFLLAVAGTWWKIKYLHKIVGVLLVVGGILLLLSFGSATGGL